MLPRAGAVMSISADNLCAHGCRADEFVQRGTSISLLKGSGFFPAWETEGTISVKALP